MPEATAMATTAPSDARSDAAIGLRWPVVLATAALFAIAFYLIEHDPESFAGMQSADTTEDRIADGFVDAIEDGSINRKVTFTLFGVLGLAAGALVGKHEIRIRRPALATAIAFVAWVALSLLWSDDPQLTFRRLVAGALILAGSAGIARALRPSELVAVVLLSLTVLVATSLVYDLSAGGRPWASNYRFGGTLHPNIQAAYCATLCLAAVAMRAGAGSRAVAIAALVFGVVMLLQTQSRTSAIALALAVLAMLTVRTGSNLRWLFGASVLGGAATTAVVIGALSSGDQRRLVNGVLMGRTEQSGTLTGRVPLWEELANYAARSPALGYGYEAFWTPDRIEAVKKSQKWALQSAHNAYLETVLQVGFIGLALASAVVISGLVLAQEAYQCDREAGYLFFVGLLVFALFSSLLESHFAKLKFPTVVAIIGYLQLILYFPAARAPGVGGGRGLALATAGASRTSTGRPGYE